MNEIDFFNVVQHNKRIKDSIKINFINIQTVITKSNSFHEQGFSRMFHRPQKVYLNRMN